MTQKATLRSLTVVQVVAVILMFPVFFCWAPWESAIPREEALARFPGQVGADWRAVTVNHGKVHEWKLGTVSQNPAGFALCTLLLVAILGVLFWSIWFAARTKRFKRGQNY